MEFFTVVLALIVGAVGGALACWLVLRRRSTPTDAGELTAARSAAAEARLEALLRRVLGFLTGAPQAQDMVAFMLREVAVEGPVFGAIYTGLIEPLHGHFCDLWSQATGQDAASESTRLRVFSLLGQVIYFRIGRPIVCRRMGWQTIGEDEADRLAEVLAANLHALIELDRRK